MLSINKANYSGNYNIYIIFNNGKEGTVNLEKTILEDERAIFSKLKIESNFKKFRVENNTVVWSNGLDLAPEYLYYIAFKEDTELQDQFKSWGYIV